MFGRKKKRAAAEQSIPQQPKPEEKPTPAYLRDDYPYKAIGDPLTQDQIDALENVGTVYEIWCPTCQMAIRSQGANIRDTYARLMGGSGCIGCGNKELVVRLVDMSAAPKPAAEKVAPAEPAPADTESAPVESASSEPAPADPEPTSEA